MKKLLFLMLLCICIMASVSVMADETRSVTISVNTVAKDGMVTVAIEYDGDANICGGSVDLSYNTSRLSLEKHEVGKSLEQTMHFVNESYGEDCIRVNWASIEPLEKSGHIITYSFGMSEDVFEDGDVFVKAVKFIDENEQKLQSDIQQSVENEYEKVTESEDKKPSKGNSGGGGGYTSSKTQTEKDEKEETETFVESSGEVKKTFDDVAVSDWYYDSVSYVCDSNLMNGISESLFGPDLPVTRAMLVTVLYRHAGEVATNRSIPFMDVDMGSYYANAVSWAKQNGIVNGVSENEFAPDVNITREDIATILFRYAIYEGMMAVSLEENLGYDDVESVSDYAISALNWAVGHSIMKGKTESTLNPKDMATRAEVATMLQRYVQSGK